jgi:hypothetical protein
MIVFSQKKRRGAVLVLALAALVVLLISSCSTVPEEVYLTEPASRFEYDPQIYFRASGPILRDIVSGLGEKELLRLSEGLGQHMKTGAAAKENKNADRVDLSSLDDILKRSRTIGAGIRGLGTDSLKMEAVLVGDFVPLSLRMGLAFDGGWNRTDDGGYQSTRYPLFIRPPTPGIVQLSTEARGPDPSSPVPSPYPAAFEEISRSDLFISADGPATLSSFSLPVESGALPLKTIALAGTYTEAFLAGKGQGSPKSPGYSLEVRMLMKDEASARAYRPVIRFLWAAAANRFFGEGSKAGALVPVQEKDSFIVRGIELDSGELRRIISSVILGG